MFSCEIFEIFKNIFFYGTRPVAASAYRSVDSVFSSSESLKILTQKYSAEIFKKLFITGHTLRLDLIQLHVLCVTVCDYGSDSQIEL